MRCTIPGRNLSIAFAIASVVGLAVELPTARAGCSSNFFTTVASATQYSYIHTPGVDPATSSTQTSVSPDFAGVFWMLGSGNPLSGVGNDSGSWPVLEGSYPTASGWARYYPGYPVYVTGNWASDARIDGCASSAPPVRCMAMLFGDQGLDAIGRGTGYFAILTAEEEVFPDYDFTQPTTSIQLSEVPDPLIINQAGDSIFFQTPDIIDPLPLFYLDGPNCDTDVVVGYKIYQYIVEPGNLAPIDRTRDNGDPGSGWEIADGGAGPAGEPIPLGSTTVVTRNCMWPSSVFFAQSLVFDSGYETPYLSKNSVFFECSGAPAFYCNFDGACGDGFACTADVCDTTCHLDPDCGELGFCSYIPDDAACDDGVSCTIDTCSNLYGCINDDICPTLPNCPSLRDCGGSTCSGEQFCHQVGGTVITDTGIDACNDNGELVQCPPGRTIFTKTRSCAQCPCCTTQPFACICPNDCGVATLEWGCGTPGEAKTLQVAGIDPSGKLSISYQPGCQSSDHQIVYGRLEDVSSYDYSGQECGIGMAGTYADFDPGSDSYFFVVVGTDSSMEGSYGDDGASVERPEYQGEPTCPHQQELSLSCD